MARSKKPKIVYQSEGLGDTIEKFTEALGIKKVIPEDCGCEERKAKLNELFKYKLKLVNCPNNSEVQWYNEFKKNRTLTISNEQRKEICRLYSNIFNRPYFEPCVNCSPKPYIQMIDKLDEVFV